MDTRDDTGGPSAASNVRSLPAPLDRATMLIIIEHFNHHTPVTDEEIRREAYDAILSGINFLEFTKIAQRAEKTATALERIAGQKKITGEVAMAGVMAQAIEYMQFKVGLKKPPADSYHIQDMLLTGLGAGTHVPSEFAREAEVLVDNAISRALGRGGPGN